eukprot:3936361-Rhodomonas_salina.1
MSQYWVAHRTMRLSTVHRIGPLDHVSVLGIAWIGVRQYREPRNMIGRTRYLPQQHPMPYGRYQRLDLFSQILVAAYRMSVPDVAWEGTEAAVCQCRTCCRRIQGQYYLVGQRRYVLKRQ